MISVDDDYPDGGEPFGHYMNAEDLVNLREPQELSAHQAVGEKIYLPTPENDEKEVVKSLMEERKALLKMKKVALEGSLIIAEWDPELKKAVTEKLEGKFTQHVGKSRQGKIRLSPEETLFLLENEFLELRYGGKPVSVEEAYSLMMTSKNANMRYLVYTNLSMLGYNVVLHQGRIDTPTSYEKKMNLFDLKTSNKKRKRKPVSQLSRKKIVLDGDNKSISEGQGVYNGVSSEQTEMEVDEPETATTTTSASSGCNAAEPALAEKITTKETVTLESEVRSELPISSEIVSDTPKKQDIMVSEDQQQAKNTSDDQQQPVNTSGDQQQPENTSEDQQVPESILEDQQHQQPEKMSEDKANSFVTDEQESENDDPSDATVTKEIDSAEPLDSWVGEERAVETSVAENPEASTTVVASSDECTEVPEVPNVDESPGSSEYEVEDEETSSLSPYSTDSIIRLDTENESTDDCMDAEIEIVTVEKKEKTPLAVINLSDDEDSSAANVNSDDDIEILEELPAMPLREIKPLPAILKVDIDSSKAQDWPFPNLLKKSLACLPRPPPDLLPSTVVMKKEAYTIDLRRLSGVVRQPVQRVWHSYRDLQQRRRGGGNPSYRPVPTWNATQDHYQTFSPQRDRSPGMRGGADWNSRGTASPQHSFTTTVFRASDMNSPVTSQSPPIYVKGETSTADIPIPRIYGNAVQQDNISQYISMAATQAAVQAARNVIMSMTGNMNVSVDCRTNPPPMASASTYNGNVAPFHHMATPAGPYMDGTSPFLGGDPHVLGPAQMNVHDGNMMAAPNHYHHHHQEASPHSFGADHTSYPRVQHVADHSSYVRGQQNNFYQQNVAQQQQQNDMSYVPSHSGSGTGVVSYQMRSSRGGGNPYPSNIPRGPRRVSSWHEYKSAVGNSYSAGRDDRTSSSGVVDDIVEVPINVKEMLWSKNLSPLARPEIIESSNDIQKCSQITVSANLIRLNAINERFMPTSCPLEISFDIYLPNVHFKKTSPGVPRMRVVVVNSEEPFPKTADIVLLARKFGDRAPLMFAAVDGKDIIYYCVNFIDFPEILLE